MAPGHPQGDAPPIHEDVYDYAIWEGHPLAGALVSFEKS